MPETAVINIATPRFGSGLKLLVLAIFDVPLQNRLAGYSRFWQVLEC